MAQETRRITSVLLPCALLSAGLGAFYYARQARCRRTSRGSREGFSPNGKTLRRTCKNETDIVLGDPPHPKWRPGEKQPPPQGFAGEHTQVDPRDCKSCYPLMISAVVPRPIAFLSTQAANGTTNVAPFSYFNTVAHNPPTLAVSICRKSSGGVKDSMRNIDETGDFVVSIISDWFVEAANHTCGDFPPEVNEMEISGLTPAKATIVSPPIVKESAVNMECKVRHKHDIVNHVGEVTTTVVFGEVVMFHVFPELLDEAGAREGRPAVSLEGFKPVARLGGDIYALLGSAFELKRPKV